NDIIPHTELPFFIPANKAQYEAQFGSEKIEKYLNYNALVPKVRAMAMSLSHQFDQGKFSTFVSAQVATTMCGVGECGETSYLAVIKLIQADCQPCVNLIECNGMIRNITQNGIEFYNHAFVIIGDMGNVNINLPLMQILESLNDDCIVLDPLLGVITQANQITLLPEVMNYFNIFGINQVANIQEFVTNASKEITNTIVEQAKKISEQAKEKLNLAPNMANKLPVKNPISPVRFFNTQDSKIPKNEPIKNDDRPCLCNLI
ncbi:hypothetical protein HY612_04920, partial [Candidatus Roizmanbacteria bacterium]|nr:hypothetical protein [Candidatus Roizmanbacteria bacterium]